MVNQVCYHLESGTPSHAQRSINIRRFTLVSRDLVAEFRIVVEIDDRECTAREEKLSLFMQNKSKRNQKKRVKIQEPEFYFGV